MRSSRRISPSPVREKTGEPSSLSSASAPPPHSDEEKSLDGEDKSKSEQTLPPVPRRLARRLADMFSSSSHHAPKQPSEDGSSASSQSSASHLQTLTSSARETQKQLGTTVEKTTRVLSDLSKSVTSLREEQEQQLMRVQQLLSAAPASQQHSTTSSSSSASDSRRFSHIPSLDLRRLSTQPTSSDALQSATAQMEQDRKVRRRLDFGSSMAPREQERRDSQSLSEEEEEESSSRRDRHTGGAATSRGDTRSFCSTKLAKVACAAAAATLAGSYGPGTSGIAALCRAGGLAPSPASEPQLPTSSSRPIFHSERSSAAVTSSGMHCDDEDWSSVEEISDSSSGEETDDPELSQSTPASAPSFERNSALTWLCGTTLLDKQAASRICSELTCYGPQVVEILEEGLKAVVKTPPHPDANATEVLQWEEQHDQALVVLGAIARLRALRAKWMR